MNNIEKFKNKYIEVFDTNGNIKNCGRKKCEELMDLAQKIKPGDYGDSDTGFLNIDNIKKLYIEL